MWRPSENEVKAKNFTGCTEYHHAYSVFAYYAIMTLNALTKRRTNTSLTQFTAFDENYYYEGSC